MADPEPSGVESAVLLHRAREGSTDAADEVLRQVGSRLLALIRVRMGRRLRDRLESGDIFQATLLKAFERFDQFDGTGTQTLMGWLAAIAQNEIRDQADFHHREKRDMARLTPIYGLESDLPIAPHLHSEASRIDLTREAQSIEEALERLEAPHREVILLRSFEELTFPEIAERMGRTPEACRKLYGRAMAALTIELHEEVSSHPGR